MFVIGEFLRVVTHAKIFAMPTSLETAVTFVDELLSSRGVHVLVPTASYWPSLRKIVVDASASGNRVFDAQIVTTFVQHGVGQVLTNDHHMAAYAGIEVIPLTA